jgi:hypothetical protein
MGGRSDEIDLFSGPFNSASGVLPLRCVFLGRGV